MVQILMTYIPYGFYHGYRQARIEELEAIRRRVAEEERRHLQRVGFSRGNKRKSGCKMRKSQQKCKRTIKVSLEAYTSA